MLFNTKRLLVRKLNIGDARPFHEMESNPNVKLYTGGETRNYEGDLEMLEDLIQKYTLKDNGFWIWAVEDLALNEFVGTVAIIVDDKNEAEIGYRFLEQYWGRGYGKEICPALINHGIKSMGLNAMYAYVDKRNTASVKILEESNLEFIKEYWNEEDQCTDRYYKKNSDANS